MNADTSAAITAAASCAQALVLIVAAVIAYVQVREARRVREEQAQPYVVVSLETDHSSPSILYLVIKNIGKTVARDVTVKFDPPLVSSLDREGGIDRIAEWTVLKDGIRTLVPGQAMSTLVDSLISRYAGDGTARLPNKFRATVSYKDDHKRHKAYSYEYDLDFNVFFGSHYVERKSVDDLVKAVDEIRKSVGSWTTDRGVRVYTKPLDEVEDEKMASFRERRLQAKIEELSAEAGGQNYSAEANS